MAPSQRKVKVKKPDDSIKIKIKFLEDCDPENGQPVFKKGSVRELKAPSANHWIRRGKAELYFKPIKKKAKKKPGRPPKKKNKEVKADVEGKKEEKKINWFSRTPPITHTDPTPEIEKES